MPVASFLEAFPRLSPANHRVTSEATPRYNCIAWSVGDSNRWWQPGEYWRPADWPRNDCGIGALERLFLSFGYVDCHDNFDFEPGYEKVALYGAGFLYTHAARQLSTGKWTSKLGKDVDIEHDSPNDLAGRIYGDVIQVMKRPIS